MTHDPSIEKLHINYELTNNIATVQSILKRNGFNKHDIEIATNQILSLLGYKYLSQQAENNTEDIGYELNEDYYYKNFLINKGNVIETLTKGIEQITQKSDNIQASEVFYDLFNLIDFQTFPENDTWLLFIELVEKSCSETSANIGEVFNFITQYPQRTKNNIYKLKPAETLAKFIAGKITDVENLYDPYATYGSLLVNIGNEINVTNYYGQHDELDKYIIAKLNLLVNGVNYKNIFIKHNNIAAPNAWSNMKFDLSVTIPPFGLKGGPVLPDDERFKPFSPKKSSELAYLLDMIYSLDDNGTIAAIVPNGLLFRGGIERKVIKHLVNNQFISTIIGLPANLFDETSIPTTLIILDKKPKEGIFYLNLMNEEIVDPNTEKPLSLDFNHEYVNIIKNQERIPYKTHMAPISEITYNDYNLSINRYVEQEQLEKTDIEKTIANIKRIKKEIKIIDMDLNAKMGDLLK